MIEFVEGVLVETTTTKALINVQGIGYGIFISLRTFEGLITLIGKPILLHTSHLLREDSERLFGFLQKSEKELFETLAPILGPKTALALLGHLSIEELAHTIENKDLNTLIKIPGVGKKTAERMLVELKGKIHCVVSAAPINSDAIQVLVNLGYSPLEAKKAIKQVTDERGSTIPLSDLLKFALQTRVGQN